MQLKAARVIAALIASGVGVMLMVMPILTHLHSQMMPSLLANAAGMLALTPGATATTAVQRSSSGGGLDPAIIAAIVGAVIAGLFGLAGILYGARLQRRIIRYQKELDTQEKAAQQEEERKASTLETRRREMLLARNNEQRAQAYRRALHADPRIARLQILEMSRPLDIASVYVRVRIHEEASLRYEVDPLLLTVEQQRDPNALLRASKTSLERRASTALDAEAAIQRYRRCVIVGDPGAGKTTLLKFLALKAVDHQLSDLPDLPVHIELNAFAAHSEFTDLLDYAAQTWDERYAFPRADARIYIDAVLKEGKALLLLDALDETVIGEQAERAEASYERACDAILRLATRYPDAPVVVTARKAGYQQRMRLAGFTELEVLDFRQEEMEQFVVNWFACVPGQQSEANAADLIEKLRRNARIQALGANPLLLSLIVLVYEAQLDLPDRRADLYRRCVDVLLTEWDSKRNIRRRREFKPEHKRQLLAELAWYFHQQGRRYFPERELEAEIGRFLPALGLPADEYERVLKEIAGENGLLKEQAHGWYGFLHLTLQEYFVAQYVTDHPQDVAVLLQQIGDPWWEEVILLYAGQTADASFLLQQLLGQGEQRLLQDDLFHTNLLIAGRCLAARPTVRQLALREEIVACLFHLLRTSHYDLTQSQAAEALAEMGGSAVNAQMLSWLANERLDWSIRWNIAAALGNMGERSVAPDLLRLLADARLNSNVRKGIAVALGRLGDRTIALDLLHLSADEQLSSDMRYSIARAMGFLGERAIAPDLLRLLADTHFDLIVRQGFAWALGSLGERAIAPDLLRLLAHEQLESGVCWVIARALGSLGERAVVPELLHLLANARLHRDVRLGISWALGSLGERAVVPDLLRLLADERLDGDVRGNIAAALGRLGERAVVPDLLRLLADERLDEYVRQDIAAVLGNMGERSVAPELLRLLANERLDGDVRGSIARALGSLGERSVAPELLRLLANERLPSHVRGRIAVALSDLVSSEEEVRALASLLPGSDKNLANAIYRALWSASRRCGVRVVLMQEDGQARIEVVRRLSGRAE